jgi:hypothetical protein
LDATQAQMYLDMAGGNVEVAMGILFSGNATIQDSAPVDKGKFSDPETAHVKIVWPEEGKEIPDKWLQEGFSFDTTCPFGLVQKKNGPCGVLAVVQGVLASQALASSNKLDPSQPVSDTTLASALSRVVGRCSPEGKDFKLASWRGGQLGGSIDVETVESKAQESGDDALATAVLASLPNFKAPGGVVLLLYSCVLTRGIEQVLQDMAAGLSFLLCFLLTLRFRRHPTSARCGPELAVFIRTHGTCFDRFSFPFFLFQGLLMRGVARGNFGAYDPMKPGQKVDWGAQPLGFISQDFEKQTSMAVCDSLKSPDLPVWSAPRRRLSYLV